jgi:hypothetical protein
MPPIALQKVLYWREMRVNLFGVNLFSSLLVKLTARQLGALRRRAQLNG